MAKKRIIKRLKLFNKRVSSFTHKFINGWKGAISILLALVTAPFLSITLLIVESVRYQSAIELMDEVIDTSAFSVLADYDTFLEERFGLMAVSQKALLNSSDTEYSFADYINKNTNAAMVTPIESKISGAYALNDDGILKQQLLECSEVSAALEMFINGLDISDLLQKLNEAFDFVDKFTKCAEAVTATVDVGNSVLDVINKIKAIKELYDKEYDDSTYGKVKGLEGYWSIYEEKYQTFEDKVNDLAVALKEFNEKNPSKSEATSEAPNPYNDPKISEAVQKADDAAKEYKDANSAYAAKFKEFKDAMDGVMSAVNGLPAKLGAVNDKVNKIIEDDNNSTSSSSSSSTASTAANVAASVTDSSSSWLRTVAEEAAARFNLLYDSSAKSTWTKALNDLTAQKGKLGQFSAKDNVKSESTRQETKNEYGVVIKSKVERGIAAGLDNIINILNQEEPAVEEDQLSIDDILTFFRKILQVKFFYDANLNSSVSKDALYTTDTDLNLSDIAFVESMNLLETSASDFKSSIQNFNIFDAVKSVIEFMGAIATFLTSLVTKIGEIAYGLATLIGQLVTDPGGLWDRLLLSSYTAYNLPNRTTYNSKKSLMGYSFGKIYNDAGGVPGGVSIMGELSEMSESSVTYGDDLSFKGAEGEYILIGHPNEKTNQMLTAFDLFLFRIMVDALPVMMNTNVTTIAGGTGPFAIFVYLAFILGEAAVDTLMIVNGVSVYLIKMSEYIYLSPGGVKSLIKDGLSMTGLSKALQKDILEKTTGSDKNKNAGNASEKDDSDSNTSNGTDKSDDSGGSASSGGSNGSDGSKDSNSKKESDEFKGLLKADYSEHLILLMLLNSCTIEKILTRMMNIIQLESGVKYKYETEGFKLSRAYTYVYTDVIYQLDPMINLETLTGDGLIRVEVDEYHGY